MSPNEHMTDTVMPKTIPLWPLYAVYTGVCQNKKKQLAFAQAN